MKTLEENCKICAGKLFLEVDEDAPDWAVQKLCNIVCCQRCHTLKAELGEARETIGRAIAQLNQARALKLKNQSDIETAIHRLLCVGTKRFCDAICAYRRMSHVQLWNVLIVKGLMAEPDKWFDFLKDYRLAIEDRLQNLLKTNGEEVAL